MALTYIEAIGLGFPGVQCHIVGDPNIYENIVWDGGEPLPSKSTIDTWIAANPQFNGLALTKYEFRKLFTLDERVAIDNAPNNVALPVNYRAILVTVFKDLDLSGEVQLFNPDVAAGVGLLEQLGLIGVGRAAQILSNTPPGA